MTAFRQRISVLVDRNLSQAAISARLAATARKALADLIGSERASSSYRRFVDGVEGTSEDVARQRIRYEFSSLGNAAQFALNQLKARSPVRSGRYRDSFFVAVDGRAIPERNFVPRGVPSDAEVFVYNTQPYSRRLDVQLDGRKPLNISVPADFFDATAAVINRQFASIKAERLYTLSVPGAYMLRTGPRQGQQVHVPALAISRRM